MITLLLGDCLERMGEIEPGSVDAVVTDPPYGLKFMGKGWDHGVPGVPFWRAMLATMKPGGYLAAFGGTRTFHRQVCAIEDAGFEIRDTVLWLYGSGFPKGKGCLKPAFEPITLARKPGPKVLPLGIDACRVGMMTPKEVRRSGMRTKSEGWGMKPTSWADGSRDPAGRWPANITHDGSDEVLEAFAAFGESRGDSPDRKPRVKPANGFGWSGPASQDCQTVGFTDTGTAARFYYAAKASKADRDEGCEGLEERKASTMNGCARPSEGRTADKDGGPKRNHHPTVKPTSLMRWLCKLVTPEGGLILDPFMGSGSTGKAATLDGFRFIGIEQSSEYLAIAQRRIQAAQNSTPLLAGVAS